jgi:hypothetical protein
MSERKQELACNRLIEAYVFTQAEDDRSSLSGTCYEDA